MNPLFSLAASLICGFWLMVIAIVASQNPTPIALRFLGLRSVPIPLGLVVALCGVLGLVMTSLLLGLWTQFSKE
ncbi:lipopolysaccharide assembly protein LapA domain-containing protein [Prochlorothrix hollandica]|uniref:Lipopolysaccharide assembly protein A domain-containing protein n=1 Tax=Prochlorothrix hollandica PCC 9006 = CALU 1027 TaxID=317619 RepID=A0A0M2PR24_PROHO|nr:lipopolysaccharide assembly protein LapA domain-containing protein [Prochlorothrix hollandica]KKI98669.1 hypothetical protein PROH_17595 [Prochlorothrix hollandica PCC 9006 = CALU 1027]